MDTLSIEQRLASLTEDDTVGPSEFFDDYEIDRHRRFVSLQASAVHGIGVFARVDLPKGTCVGAAHGPETEVSLVPAENTYMFKNPEGSGYITLAGPHRFLNDAAAPNVVLQCGNGRTRVYTLVDVDAGDELFMGYHSDVEPRLAALHRA